MDITIKLSGNAGDGVQSVGDLLTDAGALAGLHVFNFRSYGAEIRARGNSDATVRLSDEPIHSLERNLDVLMSVRNTSSVGWIKDLKKTGLIIFDSDPLDSTSEASSFSALAPPKVKLCGVPITKMAQEISGISKAKNVAALGALVSLLQLPKVQFETILRNFWVRKGQEMVDMNLKVFEAGYKYAREEYYHICRETFKTEKRKPLNVFSGNQALSQGALDANLEVFGGYPITPASTIMEAMAKELPKRGGRFIQTEDEIAAIGVVLGSGFTGVRSMTATSGPGLSLMVEQLGLSYISEIPCTIVNVQRGGPSTGLPTKTEQSDLNLALYGGHGDAERIVLAPTNVYECHSCMMNALAYAQRYQMPVILLSDFFLANRRESMATTFQKPISKDSLVKPNKTELKDYNRFKITETGISPMSVPGTEGGFYTTTGLEHNEIGTPTYTPENHELQTLKRHRKMQTALKEISDAQVIGRGKAEIGILSWGSTTGAALEASRLAKVKKINVKVFKTTVISPLPKKEIIKFAKSVSKIIVPELNFQGQFANLLGFLEQDKIIRVNYITGVPITPLDILSEIQKVNHVLRKK